MTGPFGGATPAQFSYDYKRDPAMAQKMNKAMKQLEYDFKCDNRQVRKRNQKTLEALLQGIQGGMGMVAWDVAELFYNGAPGIPSDHRRALSMYITALEAPDSAVMAAEGQEAIQQALANNILEQIVVLELEDMERVGDRLQVACSQPCWKNHPCLKLVSTYARARLAYVRGQRVAAAAAWREVVHMKRDLEPWPMLLGYVARARSKIATMQNTENGGGDAELADIAAKYDQEIAARDTMISADTRRSISTRQFKENDRTVMRFKVPEGTSTEATRADMMARMAARGLDMSQFTMQVVKATDLPGECAHCGKVRLVQGRIGHKLSSCQRCGAVQYCNKECQSAHWPEHKHDCKRLQQEGVLELYDEYSPDAEEEGTGDGDDDDAPFEPECGGCGAVGVKLKACGGCSEVSYCSRECQKGHWRTHKDACKKQQQAEQQQ